MYNLDDYEPVAERITKWWKDHPKGSIQTSPDYRLIELYKEQNIYVAVTTLYTEEGLIVANGTDDIQLLKGGAWRQFGIATTETSSIGRALANAGYATKKNRASREEMEKVNLVEQEITAKPDPWKVAEEKPSDPVPMAAAVDVLKRELGAAVVPSCKHGEMNYKEGVSSKTGRPYSGYTCSSKDRADQCEPRWNR